MIILISFYLFVNNLIKKPVTKKYILAHRGYSKSSNDENTIKSVQDAIKKKFKGVEIDIFYDKSRSDFVVSHDSYNDPTSLLSLEKILEIHCPKNFIFWLDLKNLSLKNAFNCRKKIKQYKKAYNNKYLFIESTSYISLLLVSFLSNINTSYWIYHWSQLLLPQLFTFTSLSYQNYDKNPRLYNILSKNPINLFTINNKKKLKSYHFMKRISFLLTNTEITEEKL